MNPLDSLVCYEVQSGPTYDLKQCWGPVHGVPEPEFEERAKREAQAGAGGVGRGPLARDYLLWSPHFQQEIPSLIFLF